VSVEPLTLAAIALAHTFFTPELYGPWLGILWKLRKQIIHVFGEFYE